MDLGFDGAGVQLGCEYLTTEDKRVSCVIEYF